MAKQIEIPVQEFLKFVGDMLLNGNFPLEVFVGEGGGGFKEYKEVMMEKDSVSDEEWEEYLVTHPDAEITNEEDYHYNSGLMTPTIDDIKEQIPTIIATSSDIDEFINILEEELNMYGLVGTEYSLTYCPSDFIDFMKSFEENPYTSIISEFFKNTPLINDYVNKQIVSSFCTKWNRIEKLTEILTD